MLRNTAAIAPYIYVYIDIEINVREMFIGGRNLVRLDRDGIRPLLLR